MDRSQDHEKDEQFREHMILVLSVSSGMVGVCLTAISLIGILKSLTKLELIVDDMLAISAVLFMFASALSFMGLRTGLRKMRTGLIWSIDVLFLVGLLALVAACLLLTWVMM